MSMRNKLSVLVAFLFMAVAVAPVGAVELQRGVQNSFSISYYESLFDSRGELKNPLDGMTVGDHLMGVIKLSALSRSQPRVNPFSLRVPECSSAAFMPTRLWLRLSIRKAPT